MILKRYVSLVLSDHLNGEVKWQIILKRDDKWDKGKVRGTAERNGNSDGKLAMFDGPQKIKSLQYVTVETSIC